MVTSGLVQDGIASVVAASYDIPLLISVIPVASKFAFQQELTYNGILFWLKQNFLSLADFDLEMSIYSAANPTQLSGPMEAIASLIPLNAIISSEVYVDVNMGPVGLAFMQLIGFSQTFAVDPSQLLSSTCESVVGQNT